MDQWQLHHLICPLRFFSSLILKPGSTIEWGNHWARALKFRQDNNAPVCGFFSHIGDLYMCHHLWAYKDLQSRKDTREAAWSRPGWDENVRYTGKSIIWDWSVYLDHGLRSQFKELRQDYFLVYLLWHRKQSDNKVNRITNNTLFLYTVPLIKSLRSRILIPTPFSPLQ